MEFEEVSDLAQRTLKFEKTSGRAINTRQTELNEGLQDELLGGGANKTKAKSLAAKKVQGVVAVDERPGVRVHGNLLEVARELLGSALQRNFSL